MEVTFSRCICTHGLGQSVDCIIQQLLFHRHFVPDPVPAYINSSLPSLKSHMHSKFCDQFDQVRKCITSAFRTCNVGTIQEIVLIIGGNFVSIRELYRITVPACAQSLDSDVQCSGGLSEKEHRLIARQILMQQNVWDGIRKLPPRAKRLHLLLGIDGEAEVPGFKGLMSDMFSIPDKTTANARAIFIKDITLTHGPNCITNDAQSTTKELRWFTCESVIEAPML